FNFRRGVPIMALAKTDAEIAAERRRLIKETESLLSDLKAGAAAHEPATQSKAAAIYGAGITSNISGGSFGAGLIESLKAEGLDRREGGTIHFKSTVDQSIFTKA